MTESQNENRLKAIPLLKFSDWFTMSWLAVQADCGYRLSPSE